MNIDGHDIGVCSWSLHPRDMADLVAQVKQAGLEHIQLGLSALPFRLDLRGTRTTWLGSLPHGWGDQTDARANGLGDCVDCGICVQSVDFWQGHEGC